MSTLTVKNLPDALYARLKARAGANRRSINAEAIVLLERSLDEGDRASVLGSESTSLHMSEDGAVYAVDTEHAGADGEVDPLLEEARRLSRSNAGDTVADALRAYIARMKRLSLLELMGRVDFDPEYDYKAARRAR